MIRVRRYAFFLTTLSLLSTDLFADWPAYLNGNQRTGFTNSKLEFPLKHAWTFQSPAKPVKAWEGPRKTEIEGQEMRHRVDFDAAMQVVMAHGRAYFGSTVDHRLHCVDAKTGLTKWSYYTDGPIRLAPTLAHENVYFGSDDGTVYCLTADEGSLVWKMRVGPKDDRLLSRGEMISRWPVRTGVLIDGDTAYFGAGVFPHETVYLCAVHAKDGKIIWKNDAISQQNAGRNDLSPQGYLLCNDETLFVPSGRSLPVAVSKKTGEIVFQRQHSWRSTAGGVVGGTKALLGDGQVYAGGPHHFLAMDETNGDVGASWINGRQMVLAGELAYLLDGNRLYCVNRHEHATASQEKQKWFLKARDLRGDAEQLIEAKQRIEEFKNVGILWQHETEFDDVLIATENVVIAGGQDHIIALDRETGAKIWEHQVAGNVRGVAMAGNVLTVSTDHGHVYAFHGEHPDDKQAKIWPEAYVSPFPRDELTDVYREAAKKIIARSEQTTGFCLVLGSQQGRLAWEIAQQSQLNVIGVEPDEAMATKSRKALEAAGIHATRITIVNAPLNDIPFSNYFANLIVSDSHLISGAAPCDAKQVARFLKPCGGTAVLLQSGEKTDDDPDSLAWMTTLFQAASGDLVADAPLFMVRRRKLNGAGNWSHQYGNVANTSSTEDTRISGGLGVLWYGDPGPSAMINRHEAAGAPLSTNGRMFIQGTDRLMAFDAYNGNFLWDYNNPGAIRTGVFNNRETHNLAASDDAVYVAVGDRCTALDAATGETLAEYQIPDSSDGIPRAWAYLAYDDGQVFGTSTIREELDQKRRRRGLTVKSQTDAVFAMDVETGKRMWSYSGKNILHTTIAIGPERMYFIESSITPAERQQLYLQDKGELKKLTGEAAKNAEEEMKAFDVRMAVAIDRRTGEKVWEKPVNVTDTTNVSAGGGSLTLMYADGHVVLCGANANGHYWKQFLAGEFEKRKLVVLESKNGNELWSKNANYMNRPAIIAGEIYAEPWAFDIHTGKPKTRPHPLTGKESEWRFSRPGHHCGVITATPNMMFFRSGFIGYYDLYEDSGTRHFSGQRLGCWVNAIPGNGLVMIPEASAGCVCQFSITSTVVMEPKAENKSWGILSAVGPTTPVRRMGINFGAPGDRKDTQGQEWFGYPRPASSKRLEFVFDLNAKLAEGGGWYSHNAESVQTQSDEEAEEAWLFTSGARGLQRFELPLLSAEDEKRSYKVRFYFANLGTEPTSAFDIKLQNEMVASIMSIPAGTGALQPIMHEFHGVSVTDNLAVELIGKDGALVNGLSAIEVLRED